MEKDLGKTSINVDPKLAALLSYLAGFITGIIFFLIEKDNKFVRFHAMQSIITFGAFFFVQIVIGYVPFLNMALPFISIAALILWVVCMIKAYQGETFKLPIVGDIAEQKV